VSKFAPNEEQAKIVEASKDRNMNIAAADLAGTGKTTTMVSVAEANPYASILYIAYNSSTKMEAKGRFPRHVRVVTSHGLAYSHYVNDFGARLNAKQPRSRDAARTLGLPEEMVFAYCLTCDTRVKGADGAQAHASHAVIVERMQGWRVASLVRRTLERFCYSDFDAPRQRHVPTAKGIDERVWPAIRVEVTKLAIRAWNTDITNPEGKLWFTHDCYLKMYQLTKPTLRQRVIILDEAQDTNDCVWDIIRNQRGKQVILVGDSNQMIYEWRGSKDVMSLLHEAVGTRPMTELPLQGSYRFGPEIADAGNDFLRMLETDHRMQGLAAHESKVVQEIAAGDEWDAEIYRTNAGTIGGAMRALEAGLKVAIVGGGAAIQYLAEAAEALMNGRTTDHPELVGFQTWEDVKQYIEEEPEDAGTLVPIVKAIEEYGPQAIIDMTRSLVKEDIADRIVTTAHKSKGREWRRVLIGDDFPQPLPGRTPRKEELRLGYVAVTRGMEWVCLSSLAYARNGI